MKTRWFYLFCFRAIKGDAVCYGDSVVALKELTTEQLQLTRDVIIKTQGYTDLTFLSVVRLDQTE